MCDKVSQGSEFSVFHCAFLNRFAQSSVSDPLFCVIIFFQKVCLLGCSSRWGVRWEGKQANTLGCCHVGRQTRWGVVLNCQAKTGTKEPDEVAAPGKNPNVNVLSMKWGGALPTKRQLAHIALHGGEE